MSARQEIHFGPFHLDLGNQQLWRGSRQLPLQPKPLAVLHYLVENPGRLVRKQEFMEQAWPGTQVTPRSLIGCISVIRQVLDGSPQAPEYIETLGPYGYRCLYARSEGPRRSSARGHLNCAVPQAFVK